MYLRRERKTFKSGTRTYVSVAHNVVEKPAGKAARAKPVVLMNLGNEADLDPNMVSGIMGVLRKYLAERLAKGGGATTLETAQAVAKELGPQAAGIRKLLSKQLGLRPLIEAAWKELGLGATLRLFQLHHRLKFPLERLVFGLVWNRLADPKSKLAANDWLKDTVYFPEAEKLAVHHHYRALDVLEEHADELQVRELAALRRKLPAADWKTICTDTTSSYFESSVSDEDRASIAAEWARHDAAPDLLPEPAWPRPQVVNEPPLRMQGHSKDERPRSPQVVIGFLANRDGLVLFHQVHAGNKDDGHIALDLVERFEELVSIEGATWVGDAGMGTGPTLDELDNRDGLARVSAQSLRKKFVRKHVVGKAGRYRKHPTKKDWSYRVVEVTQEESPHGRAEQWIVTRNDKDRKRRLELLEKHVARVEAALAIDDRIDGKAKGVLAIVSNKGLKKYVKRLKGDRGRYRLNKRKVREERRLAGLASICATDLTRDPIDVLGDYRALMRTEKTFRDMKGPIRLRPMYHRAAHRIRGHVLVCTLAVNVMRFLEAKLGMRFDEIKKAWENVTASLMERDGKTWWQRDVYDVRQLEMLAKLGAKPGPEIWKTRGDRVVGTSPT
jgi:hypothetical protein